jgi:hypothetical protein
LNDWSLAQARVAEGKRESDAGDNADKQTKGTDGYRIVKFTLGYVLLYNNVAGMWPCLQQDRSAAYIKQTYFGA